MVHHMQRDRRVNLTKISQWIGNTPKDKINRDSLMRKAQLELGCSKATAKEYIGLVLDEQQ